MAEKRKKNLSGSADLAENADTVKKDTLIVKKDMLIGDIVSRHPEAAEVMLSHGLHCIGCHAATWETLEQGAGSHGIDADKMTADINKAISEHGS